MAFIARAIAVAAAMTLAVPVGAVTIGPMSETQIRAALVGKIFEGEYPSGAAWRESFDVSGNTIYQEGGQTDLGTMTFQGNVICFDYGDPTRSGGCFNVWQRGANCFDFYSTGNIATRLQRDRGTAWDARAWEEGKTRDCTADLIG
ncbi:hypothetical protein [Ahrensia sp. R2A130]|uniref:hypothetical protein n=1 Tax=Ahrensia sp. R2A130 TaxID=744979 RepID=UPI0018DD566B|nr:hypothetical protein [Ahrensia sp. R2A130]